MHQLDIYWINIDLKFRNKVPIQGFDLTSNAYVRGAIMSFGITAGSENEARELIINNLKEDLDLVEVKFDVEVNEVGIIDPNDVHKEIYEDDEVSDALLHSPHEPGLWYRSGKAYYDD